MVFRIGDYCSKKFSFDYVMSCKCGCDGFRERSVELDVGGMWFGEFMNGSIIYCC